MSTDRIVYSGEYVSVRSDSVQKVGEHRKTSSCTIILAVLLMCAIVAIIALVATMLVTEKLKSNDQDGEGKDICNTPECVEAAARIYTNIDHSVKPCDDFYKYACGGWREQNVIAEHSSTFNAFSKLRDVRDIQIRNILEEEPKKGDFAPMSVAKKLYASCKNEELLETRGDKFFKDWLFNTFGGWPLITKDWDEDAFDLTKTLVDTGRYGGYGIISLYVGINPKNSTRRVMKMDQPSLGMPGQKYYLVARNDSMLMAYETFIYEIAEELGLADPATAKADVKDLVDFEIKLAEISVRSEERRDSNKLYNPSTVAEMDSMYSSKIGIDIQRYLTSLMSSPGVGVTDILPSEPIINLAPQFFSRLGDLMQATKKRTIANYIMMKVVWKYIGTLTQAYRDIRQEYYKVLYGVKKQKSRDIHCASFTSNWLYLAVGRGYVSKYFDKSSKDAAFELVTHLQAAFNDLLEDISWMDDKTREVAKEKNDYIRARIGYSDELFNDTAFEAIPFNMTMDADKYFENKQVIQKTYGAYWLRRLREPVDKDKWYDSPQTINAFYVHSSNKMEFPAGVLQPPFFQKNYPKYLNFGGIGTIIGHEITHGFDDRGRQYDKDGNLQQWWEDDIIERFNQQKQCLVEQYGNFTVEDIDMNLNGIKTQGENIADNGGIKESFKAYKKWVSDRGQEEPSLPGLSFTNDQLFYMAFAQLWCSLDKKEALINSIRSGNHSPGEFRVTGSLQNSKEFAKAFNCPRGSPMNPTKKCTVW